MKMAKDFFGNKTYNINEGISGVSKGKRTLGIREKKILYEAANHKCENCGNGLDFLEMQSGHKTAASKNGKATLSNSVCLCYKCNNLQGNDSWEKFRKKLNKPIIPTATSHLKRKSNISSEKSNKSSSKKPRKSNDYFINPLTGRKERLKNMNDLF